MEIRMLEGRCMLRPTWELMARAYDDYKKPGFGICYAGTTFEDDEEPEYDEHGRPRRLKHRNQCAVRMSVALERCGFSLSAFGSANDDRWNRGRGRRVHRDRAGCRLNVPHVLGASELARYIRAIFGGTTERFCGGRASAYAVDVLQGRRGIVYFNNCFTRRNGTAGDHIDLWDGREYWNMKLRVSAGGGVPARSSLFERSDEVWYFVL